MTHQQSEPLLRLTAFSAAQFAMTAHKGQRDKAGLPYIEHIKRVAAKTGRALLALEISQSDVAFDQTMQIAWLHDVIEDTTHTGVGLEAEGFTDNVIEGVCLLSRGNPADPGGSYQGWIAELCRTAPLPVLVVKLADMEDDADPERLALLPEDVRARLTRKYAEPLAMLRAAVERERA